MNVNLKVKTFELTVLSNGISRHLMKVNPENKKLLEMEEFLRRKAYLESAIYFDDSLFDDSDMTSSYFLTVIYDCNTKTPLLTSRYYYDFNLIKKHLHGDMYFQNGSGFLEEKLDFENLEIDKMFMADRLAGNFDNDIYKKHHKEIFELYHKEIYSLNPNSTIFLLVRIHHSNLLQKYNKLGFKTLGMTPFHGITHSVLMLDMSTVTDPFTVIEKAY